MRLDMPRWGRAPLVVLVPVFAILWLAPLAWTVASGLRPANAVFQSFRGLDWRTFIPDAVTAENVAAVAHGTLGRAILNSLIVAGATVAVGVLISAMAAYGLTAFRFRGRGFVSYIGLILPGVGNGLAIFLLRQFYLDIPAELAEAASIDGAGAWRVFRHVYLPLTGPAMVGAGPRRLSAGRQ